MSARLRQRVTAQDVKTFENEGVVCLRGVFDQRWLDRVAAGIDRNLAEPSGSAQRLTIELWR